MSDFKKIATAAMEDWGLMPWPVATNKRPAIDGWANDDGWEPPSDLLEHFDGAEGWGILPGSRSGHLEMLEFEGRAVAEGVYDDFLGRLADAGMAEVWEQVAGGMQVQSPSGGLHFYYRVDGQSWPNTKLALRPADEVELEVGLPKWLALIETRGEGGFVVGPMSNGKTHPQGGQWTLVRGKPKTITTITVAQRTAIVEIAASFDERPEIQRTDDWLEGGVAAADLRDYVVDQIGVEALLNEAGWQYSHTTRGGEQQWTRPRKSVKDGTSATLYPDGSISVWTTTIDEAWQAALTESGQGWMWAGPVGILAAVRHGGSIAEAMSYCRAAITLDAELRDPEDAPEPEAPKRLLLEPEFWERRELFGVILQAARSAQTSPDAVLAAFLSRFAAKIPPTVKIGDSGVGQNATLDFLSCVVGDSSAGKTIANGAAGLLLPVKDDGVILADQSPGSGEGLLQAFMDWERNEKGKKIGDPSYKHSTVRAIHVVADEGSGLAEQAGRDGSTIMQTLCSAWSGAQMGQLNAKQETKRIVPAGKRRVSATVNIQTRYGHKLLQWVHVGLPQRVLFVWAHDEDTVDEYVEMPEPWLVQLPMQDVRGEIEVPMWLREWLRAERGAANRGERQVGEYDGHRNLVRLKIAALLALAENRREVSQEDWDDSGDLVEVSGRVREHLLEVAGRTAAEEAAKIGRRQARIQGAADEHAEQRERLVVDRLASRIAAAVEEAGGEMTGRAASRKLTSSKTRHRFDDALELAMERGIVTVSEGPDGVVISTP